ncbi:MAG: disulfide bond formation protein B [Actinomycetota bacterium]
MEPVDVANTFFTILALLANAAVATAVVLAGATLVSGSARRLAGSVVDVVGPSAGLLAWFVAATATLGSLYYSEIADFVPCRLCWFQRICMYPLAVVLLVGVVLRDRRMRWYAVPFVAAGVPLSLYHFLMERGVFTESRACSATVPCAVPWFTELGFVTLAYMALSGFLLIGTLLLVDGVWERRWRTADPAGPDEATGVPTGNHGGPGDAHEEQADAPAADDEPGPDPALEVRT